MSDDRDMESSQSIHPKHGRRTEGKSRTVAGPSQVYRQARAGAAGGYNEEACILVSNMSEAIIGVGDRVTREHLGDAERSTIRLMETYIASLTCLADRDVLRACFSATLWPRRTLAKQLLVLKTRMIRQIAGQLKKGQDAGSIQVDLNRYQAAFVLFSVFAGALTTYLQDEESTLDSAQRMAASGVAHVFRTWRQGCRC